MSITNEYAVIWTPPEERPRRARVVVTAAEKRRVLDVAEDGAQFDLELKALLCAKVGADFHEDGLSWRLRGDR